MGLGTLLPVNTACLQMIEFCFYSHFTQWTSVFEITVVIFVGNKCYKQRIYLGKQKALLCFHSVWLFRFYFSKSSVMITLHSAYHY